MECPVEWSEGRPQLRHLSGLTHNCRGAQGEGGNEFINKLVLSESYSTPVNLTNNAPGGIIRKDMTSSKTLQLVREILGEPYCEGDAYLIYNWDFPYRLLLRRTFSVSHTNSSCSGSFGYKNPRAEGLSRGLCPELSKHDSSGRIADTIPPVLEKNDQFFAAVRS